MNISRWIALYKNKKKESLLKEMNPSYKYKYAFVGVGQHSLSVFYPILNFIQTPLKYILTQQSSLGNLLLSKFPGATATNNYHQILDDPEIKGIFICSHPSSHFKLIEQALKHNKHVFVEKTTLFIPNRINPSYFRCKYTLCCWITKKL